MATLHIPPLANRPTGKAQFAHPYYIVVGGVTIAPANYADDRHLKNRPASPPL
jgi:hypothetical protein